MTTRQLTADEEVFMHRVALKIKNRGITSMKQVSDKIMDECMQEVLADDQYIFEVAMGEHGEKLQNELIETIANQTYNNINGVA